MAATTAKTDTRTAKYFIANLNKYDYFQDRVLSVSLRASAPRGSKFVTPRPEMHSGQNSLRRTCFNSFIFKLFEEFTGTEVALYCHLHVDSASIPGVAPSQPQKKGRVNSSY